jgi:hypothetical protein
LLYNNAGPKSSSIQRTVHQPRVIQFSIGTTAEEDISLAHIEQATVKSSSPPGKT